MSDRIEPGLRGESPEPGAQDQLAELEKLLTNVSARLRATPIAPIDDLLRSQVSRLVTEAGAWLTALPNTSIHAVTVTDHDGNIGLGYGPTVAEAVQLATEKFRRSSDVGDEPGVESAEVLARVRAWAGGAEAALFWYRSQPISAFGDRTAESLVKSGQAAALRDYLDSLALGGYA